MTTIEERIVRVMQFQTEPISAWAIQRLTKTNYNSTRVTLRRMADKGTIKQNDTGLYISQERILLPSGIVQERLRMHGIKLETGCNINKRGLSFEAARDVTTGAHRHKTNKSITYSEEWQQRLITITHHEKANKVEVWLQSTNNDMDFSDMVAFGSFIQGRFPFILQSQWEVTMLGINWDTDRFGLQGIQKLSFQRWTDIWFNIYRRESGKVRIEAHSTKKMGFQDLLETFSLFVNVIDSQIATK